jgi:predicted nucleic acid-binding protein
LTKWVIDCSFAAALFLPDKASSRVNRFFSEHSDSRTLHVPMLWWYEMTNVLCVAERKKMLKEVDVQRITGLLSRFPLETDEAWGFPYIRRLYEVARTYGLSSYDAAYLELAIRIDAQLATLDKELIAAASACGVATHR